MQEYLVRTCLKCNHSFKSKADSIHIRCSNCGSVKVVNALEMPPQLSQDIKIKELQEIIESKTADMDDLRNEVRGMRKRLNDTIRAYNEYVNPKAVPR